MAGQILLLLLFLMVSAHTSVSLTTSGNMFIKDQSIPEPLIGSASAKVMAGCLLDCIGERCDLSAASSKDNYCLIIKDTLANNSYYFKENTVSGPVLTS